MTTIGSTSPAIPYVDRATHIQRYVESYNRQEGVKPKTIEEATAQFDESDRLAMQGARAYENFLAGKATYLGSENGYDLEGYERNLELARQARSKSYAQMSGPVTINALDVDSAVTAQGKLTGGDLKTLSSYADYLRNELAAAKQVKSDVTFIGGWGKNVTTDVNEYISWLFQAAQQKSQGAAAA